MKKAEGILMPGKVERMGERETRKEVTQFRGAAGESGRNELFKLKIWIAARYS